MSYFKSLNELKGLSDNGCYPMPKIEWWLLKYEDYYKDVKYQIDNIPEDFQLPRFCSQYTDDFNFADLFELLDEVSKCQRNEKYFEEKLQEYDNIKNNIDLLDSWLNVQYQDVDNNKLKFDMQFADSREKLDYRFKLIIRKSLGLNIQLSPNDFKFSLRYCKILKKSKMFCITGNIIRLDDLQSFEEERIEKDGFINIRPAYTKQQVIIDPQDEHENVFLVKFLYGKTKLLNGLKLNQRVKIYVDVRGGVNSSNKEAVYTTFLLGWDIEHITNQ